MTDYINPVDLEKTRAYSNFYPENALIVATAVASWTANCAATTLNVDLLVPRMHQADNNYTVSIAGNASTSFTVAVRNKENYLTGTGVATSAFPLLATYGIDTSNGAVGNITNISGLYLNNEPTGTYAARLGITNTAADVNGSTLYITVRAY